MSEGRRRRLAEARRKQSPAEDVAQLRSRLRALMASQPDDSKLMLWAAQVLAQASATEKRLGQGDSEELAENVRIVLDNFGQQFMPDEDRKT
jgi:hypothetical protein